MESPSPLKAPQSILSSKMGNSQQQQQQHGSGPYAVDQVLIARANAAAEAEKGLSLRQSMRIYKKAVFWSMCLSLALVMEGYDLGIVSRIRASSSGATTSHETS